MLSPVPPSRPVRTLASLILTAVVMTGCTQRGTRVQDPYDQPRDLSKLDQDELYHGTSTMLEFLNGRLPGVEVYRTGGRLAILIRGINSVYARSEALIVVDGVQSSGYDLASMNPKDVAEVEVLKDGSAAAYGVRGANGVLLVTTRRAPGGQR